EDGPTLRALTRLSAELGVRLAGTLLLRERQSVFNVFALVEPGGKIHKYRKQHPFLWERCYFEPGREPLIVETEIGRIGLMVCWDIAHRAVSEAYRGKIDLLLIASAPPRFHRAVLNFPLGRKVYLAQLMPVLLRDRDVIDGWYSDEIASRAAWIGAPIVHSVMAGRFVAEPPFPRLSFLASTLTNPRYWPLVPQAHLATLRATFYGSSAVFSAKGETLANVEGEEGIAIADVSSDGGPHPDHLPDASSGYLLPKIPFQLRVMDSLLKPLADSYYRRHR
ncbi:MAG: carbon-nitrogen hydrolase family protein, partial [Chloroflexi bacterium]|nr:carbon-nitrogen hydrolase family protein [Chloroflexota bacterium]